MSTNLVRSVAVSSSPTARRPPSPPSHPPLPPGWLADAAGDASRAPAVRLHSSTARHWRRSSTTPLATAARLAKNAPAAALGAVHVPRCALRGGSDIGDGTRTTRRRPAWWRRPARRLGSCAHEKKMARALLLAAPRRTLWVKQARRPSPTRSSLDASRNIADQTGRRPKRPRGRFALDGRPTSTSTVATNKKARTWTKEERGEVARAAERANRAGSKGSARGRNRCMNPTGESSEAPGASAGGPARPPPGRAPTGRLPPPAAARLMIHTKDVPNQFGVPITRDAAPSPPPPSEVPRRRRLRRPVAVPAAVGVALAAAVDLALACRRPTIVERACR